MIIIQNIIYSNKLYFIYQFIIPNKEETMANKKKGKASKKGYIAIKKGDTYICFLNLYNQAYKFKALIPKLLLNLVSMGDT